MLDRFYREHNVSRETQDALAHYKNLLIKWQKAKNLIAPSTVAEADRRHFLDSLQLIPTMKSLARTGPIMDIGSGAGFPGMVIALAGMENGFGPVHLVESNGKKASFLQTVARETGRGQDQQSVFIHNDRIEKLEPMPVSIITARACATVSQLINWCRPFLFNKPVFVLLKGEKADQELTEAQKAWDMTVQRFQSISDPSGQILVLSEIEHRLDSHLP